MAIQPTIYIVASDQHRNGKTLLARLLADYLLLDGRDPFLIDTDAPEGPLRTYFPGRTALADFAAITGQMKLFDTILGAPGRDYIIDLPARHTESFFGAERDLSFFRECKAAEFRVFLFFVVDESMISLKAAKALQHYPGVDLFVPVRNMLVRSAWPEDDGALTIPFLPAPVALAIGHRRFSFRNFVQGDMQNLPNDMQPILQAFLYETLSNLSNLEPVYSLKVLQS
jgi:hypothetical protein